VPGRRNGLNAGAIFLAALKNASRSRTRIGFLRVNHPVLRPVYPSLPSSIQKWKSLWAYSISRSGKQLVADRLQRKSDPTRLVRTIAELLSRPNVGG
jgi:hypothetical protein